MFFPPSTDNSTKVNGVAYPATPATNTVPVVTANNTVTYEAVPNAALAHSSITITAGTGLTGGGAVSLGGAITLNATGGGGGGSGTPGGSDTQIQYNSSGSFAGASGLTTDGTSLTIENAINETPLTVSVDPKTFQIDSFVYLTAGSITLTTHTPHNFTTADYVAVNGFVSNVGSTFNNYINASIGVPNYAAVQSVTSNTVTVNLVSFGQNESDSCSGSLQGMLTVNAQEWTSNQSVVASIGADGSVSTNALKLGSSTIGNAGSGIDIVATTISVDGSNLIVANSGTIQISDAGGGSFQLNHTINGNIVTWTQSGIFFKAVQGFGGAICFNGTSGNSGGIDMGGLPIINCPSIPTVPTLVSAFTNDAGYLTSSTLGGNISSFTNDVGYITVAGVTWSNLGGTAPTNVSYFTNDANYVTSSSIPTNVSSFTNDAGYLTSSSFILPTNVQGLGFVSVANGGTGVGSYADLITALNLGSVYDAAGAAAAITATSLGLGGGVSTTLNLLDADGVTTHSLTFTNGVLTSAS